MTAGDLALIITSIFGRLDKNSFRITSWIRLLIRFRITAFFETAFATITVARGLPARFGRIRTVIKEDGNGRPYRRTGMISSRLCRRNFLGSIEWRHVMKKPLVVFFLLRGGASTLLSRPYFSYVCGIHGLLRGDVFWVDMFF